MCSGRDPAAYKELRMETGAVHGPIRDAHGFEDRYGERLVRRGIATYPSLLLRWQQKLQLADADVLVVLGILTYYRTPGQWPSVSVDKLKDWRGVSRRTVERALSHLQKLGYLKRAGRDRRYQTYYYDLSGLLTRLEEFADVEVQVEEFKKRAAELKARAGDREQIEPISRSQQTDASIEAAAASSTTATHHIHQHQRRYAAQPPTPEPQAEGQ